MADDCIQISSDDIVEELDKPFRVNAGPGAGKTYWLARHIVNVLRNSEKVKGPAKIACISFTNIAVETISKMIHERLGSPTRKVHVSTIHSFLFQYVVRPYLHLLKDENGECLVQHEFVNRHDEHHPDTSKITQWLNGNNKSKQLYFNNKKEFDDFLKNLQWKLSEDSKWVLSANRKTPQYFPTRSLGDYKNYYWQDSIIDHEDVLYFAYRLLEEYPFLRNVLACKFPYLFIDEFQDTNAVQTQVVRWLAENGSIVGIIGDPQQSIYGFRNACDEDFRSFSLPNLVDFEIADNRRSYEQVIQLLNCARRDGLKQACAVPSKKDSSVLFLVGGLEWGIAKYKELSGFPAPGTAILGRGNKDVHSIRCIDKGTTTETDIDISIISAGRDIFLTNLLEAMIAAKELRYGPAFNCCLKALRVTREGKFKNPIDYPRAVTEFERRGIAQYLLSLISEFLDKTWDTSVLDFYHSIADVIEENFIGLRFSRITRGNPKAFAEEHNVAQLLDSITSSEDSRVIRTIHKAKGDEFDCPLVYFEKEKRINHLLPGKDDSEEHRITYVAVSRAKQRLFILTPTLTGKQMKKFEENNVAYKVIFET